MLPLGEAAGFQWGPDTSVLVNVQLLNLDASRAVRSIYENSLTCTHMIRAPYHLHISLKSWVFFLVFYFLNFKIFNSYMRSQT